MKNVLKAGVFALALCVSSAFADDVTGVITCSKCKKTGAAAADCAKSCIKGGIAPILVSSDGKTYKIANPDMVGDHVNEKVVVKGSIENDTVTIESVTPA